MSVEHAAPVEVRAAGRTLVGRGMVYGEVAPGYRERFEPGGLVGIADPFPLVLQHDTSLVLASTADTLRVTDTPTAFEARAELDPDSAALTLVRSGALGGMSVGFVAHRERRDHSGLRVVEQYSYSHLGLVDRPAYPASTVEVRARMNALQRSERLARITAHVPVNRPLACECSGADCHFASFAATAFEQSLREIEAGDRDVVAVVGSYDDAIASTSSGTLRLNSDDDGALQIDVDVPDTGPGRKLLELERSAGIVARPFVRDETPDQSGSGIRWLPKQDKNLYQYYRRTAYRRWAFAGLRAIIFSSTDSRAGWSAPIIEAAAAAPQVYGAPPAEQPPAPGDGNRAARRVARIWL